MKDNTLKDQFNYFVGGYFGIREMDEYELKVYILKEVEEYITEFVLKNPISNFDYREEAIKIEENMNLKTKLQDALIVLHKINAPMEIIFMVKSRLKSINT